MIVDFDARVVGRDGRFRRNGTGAVAQRLGRSCRDAALTAVLHDAPVGQHFVTVRRRLGTRQRPVVQVRQIVAAGRIVESRKAATARQRRRG